MMRRIIASSTAGTALEWYDYFAYGTAAALVFNQLFFPKIDPVTGTLLAFLAFASGFLMRPLGAAFFGHLGDRRGRRFTLILTMTIMGASTGLIGLLPNYAAIGVGAPILLVVLRLIQGFSLGGEWGGATTLVLEHAPRSRRALYQMFVQWGAPIGTLLSTGLFSIFGSLPGSSFAAWGWRIPFLLSFVLLFLGLYMRLGVEESPLYKTALRNNGLVKLPLASLLKAAWGRLIAGFFIVQLSASGFYLVTTFVTNYGTVTLDLNKELILNSILIATALQMVVIGAYGWLADRFGVNRVFIVAALLAVACAFPAFALIDTREAGLVRLGIILGIIFVTTPFGIVGVILGRFYPDATRYTGLALTYNLGSVVGGFMPAIALTVLTWSNGHSWGVALLLALIGIASLLGAVVGNWITNRARARGEQSVYSNEVAATPGVIGS